MSVEALSYSRILLEDLAMCSRCYGYPDEFQVAVNRLRHDCTNMKDGPQLKTMIDEYVAGRWNSLIMADFSQWQRDNPLVHGHNADTEMGLIVKNRMGELADFIRQLLMDCDCIRTFYSGGEV